MNIDRRQFMSKAAIAASASPLLDLFLSRAMASEACNDWVDVPGFGGRLKAKDLLIADPSNPVKASSKLVMMENGVVIPRHLHPEGEFTYVVDGEFYVAGNEERIYTKGDSIYMPPGSIHEANIACGVNGVIVISISPIPNVFRF